MHELERRIKTWRAEWAPKLAARRDVLDELEAHLRDELDRALAPALGPAWDAAVAKLGDPLALANEFAKATPPARWLPARLVCLGWAGMVLLLAVGATQFLSGNDLLLGVHVLFVLLGYLTTLLVGALGICFAVSRPFSLWHDGKSKALRRVALPLTIFAASCTLVGILLGMEWARRAWNSPWSWDGKEIGALAVLGGNVLLASLLAIPRVPDRWRITFVVFNNAAVCLAWFHPLLGGDGLHSYGSSEHWALVVWAFLALQMGLAFLVAAPSHWLMIAPASASGK